MPELCKVYCSYFRYNADTGQLFWRARASNRAPPGSEVGTIDTKPDGRKYLRTALHNEKLYVHRIIMTMIYGSCPDFILVDHRDGNGLNNRIDNLRFADPALNSANHRRKPGPSGYVGVNWWKTKRLWKARIGIHREQITLGCFTRIEDAIAARKAAEELFKNLR